MADLDHSFLLSGSGELIEPDDGDRRRRARAATTRSPPPGRCCRSRASRARDIVQRSLEIAADICVFTNRHITILELPGEK